MLRLADNLFERFSDERIGGRALWADVVVEPLEVHVPTSLRPITADEYGVIVDGFHACMAKRCDELNPPPQTV
ncbi:MAG TPA: hypothetical protein VLF40_03645 [Candidatus Saccharimonadales bacterium]|nr:hypothetical protein [Candidatus Saccharimonadales bacterium]